MGSRPPAPGDCAATRLPSSRRWRKSPPCRAKSSPWAPVIDGKTIAADLRGEVAAETRRLTAAMVCAGAGGRAGRRKSGEQGLCRQANRARWPRPACSRSTVICRPSQRERIDRAGAKLNADPAVHGILVQLPLPPQIDASKHHRHCRPGQGRRRLSSAQCRPAGACRRWCRARRSAASCSPRPCMRRCRPGGGGGRPFQHRRQAAGAIAARRECDRHHRAFAHAAILPAVCRRADLLFAAIGRPNWCAAIGSSRARP